MSDALQREDGDDYANKTPTMFPPADELPLSARDAALNAVERALAASLRLSRVLPLAPQLDEAEEASPREATLPEDDPAIRRLRERIEPVAMRVPPPDEPVHGGPVFAWVTGGIALAAVVALLAAGALSLPSTTSAWAGAMWSRVFTDRGEPAQAATDFDAAAIPTPSPEQTALAERFIATRLPAEQPQPSVMVPQTVKVERVVMPQAEQPAQSPEPPLLPAPRILRTLDRDELAALYDRSRGLIEQGDIASARLMLTRAAEAGDARSALALGATYDPDALKKLGVIGLRADPAQAQAWYSKAVDLGSAEAVHRLEQLAQAGR